MLRFVFLAGFVMMFSQSHSFELNPVNFIPQKIMQNLCTTFCYARSRTLIPQIQEMSAKTYGAFCGMCLPKDNSTSSEAPSQPGGTKPGPTPSGNNARPPPSASSMRMARPPPPTPPKETGRPASSSSPGAATDESEKKEEVGTTVSS